MKNNAGQIRNLHLLIFLGALLILVALPVTIFLSQQKQEIRQSATANPTPIPPNSSSTVFIQNMQFTPHGLAVPIGTTVTWTNQDTMAHTTTSDNPTAAEHWDSGILQPGQSFTKTFTIPGQYSYHCNIHTTMTGFIEVFRSTSQTPTPQPTCTVPPPCIYGNPRCLPPVPVGGWCPISVTPKPTCIPCLNPAECAVIPVPIGGWCPITPTISQNPSPTPPPGCFYGACPLMCVQSDPNCCANYKRPLICPSTTPNPLSTNFSFSAYLHGIGKGGDNVNPNSTGNENPIHTERTVTVFAYDKNNTLITRQGTISYASASGNFSGMVDMGNIPGGLYLVKVKTDGFLQRMAPGIQQITPKKINNIPAVYLVTGDINNDNQLDLLDYNLLIGCFGSKANTESCLNKTGSDLNDDGSVDGGDYNLFLRELSVQSGDAGPNMSPTPTVSSQLTPTPLLGCHYESQPCPCTTNVCPMCAVQVLVCPSGTPTPSPSPLSCNSCSQQNKPYFCMVTVNGSKFCSDNANACAGQGNCYCSVCSQTSQTPTP